MLGVEKKEFKKVIVPAPDAFLVSWGKETQISIVLIYQLKYAFIGDAVMQWERGTTDPAWGGGIHISFLGAIKSDPSLQR